MIVLDASALIALVNERDHQHTWARDLFVSTHEHEWVISVLNYAEVMVRPARVGNLEIFLAGISGAGIAVEPVTADDATQLASLRATTALKMPDVVALQLALRRKAAIATADSTLAFVARAMGCTVLAPE